MYASMEDSVAQSLTTTALADQMYPKKKKEAESSEPLSRLPSDYSQHFAQLTAHLGRAMDLCQHLAASSFKTKASSDLLKIKVRKSFKNSVRRQESTPLSLTPEMKRVGVSVVEPWQQLLAAKETNKQGRQRGALARVVTEPVLSVPPEVGVRERGGEGEGEKREEREATMGPVQSGKTSLYRSNTRYDAEKKKVVLRSSLAGDLFSGNDQDTRPVHSHMMSLIAEGEGGKGAEGGERKSEGPSSSLKVENDDGSEEGEYSLLSTISTSFSDTDVKQPRNSGLPRNQVINCMWVNALKPGEHLASKTIKQVMTKIAVLEEERLKLLETVDQIQSDNQRVRLSLHETVGDLENKDMQLMLAMQDLTLATGEIKKVAGLRAQLDTMEKERGNILEKLSTLEDESSAVKVSLIQLLQEKSATNKTLALENWRLRQSASNQDTLSRTNSRSSTAPDPPLTYMMEEDLTNYVHKQGFLVKQGRRVKNWKRRLFVLDSTGLSYYKTEQPIQRVCLSSIKKIQRSHNHVNPPHTFEVHTPERVFLLSAPSEDEMQSWIGMLQTLKQYARQRSPPKPAAEGEPGQTSTPPNGVILTDAILHQIVRENGDTRRDSRTLRTPTLSVGTPETSIQVRGDQVGVAQVGGAMNGKVSGSPLQRRYLTATKGVGNGTRPRSQAILVQKGLSLDEAIPDSSRPMSAMVTFMSDSNTSGMEPDQTTVTDSTYHNRVLSQSHPGTRTHELAPAVILET